MILKQSIILKVFFLSELFFLIYCQTSNIPYVRGLCPQNKYLSSIELSCIPCTNNAIQSPNGLSCICKPGYIYTQNGGGFQVKCSLCAAPQIPAADGWSCVNPVPCQSPQILVTTDLFGNPLNTCAACASPRYISNDNQCKLCLNFLNTNNNAGCSCSTSSTGSACLTSAVNLDNTTVLTYQSTTRSSSYLQAYMMDSFALCQAKIDSGCQALASMCAMAVYQLADYTDKRRGPCGLFGFLQNNLFIKVQGFPFLYYQIGQSLDQSIDHQYIRGESLQLMLAAYDIGGTFLGFRNATRDGNLQMCSTSLLRRSETFRFGTRYRESCSIPLAQLLNQTLYPPTLYDPYLAYTDPAGVLQLYPIPIKIGQIKNAQGSFPNLGFTPANWIFTRRLLLVDNFGSVPAPFQTNKTAEFLTYTSSLRLVVVKQYSSTFDISTDGRINVPYLEVNLTTVSGTASSDTSSPGSDMVSVSFEVVYQNQASYDTAFQYSLSVAMGVLCAVAGLYSILRAFFWCRRSGIAGFEALVLLKTLAHACAAISNVFFLIMFGVSLYFLLLYKNQRLFSIVPPDDDTFFLAYLICAFLLKLLEIIHIFVSQCTVDIFLIDWERPKHVHAPKQVIERSKFDRTEESGVATGDYALMKKERPVPDSGVSIWRSYFIANEWREIQTYRKTSLVFNLVVVLLFMEVIGFGNITRFDPNVIYNPASEAYKAPYYRMFRFAVIVSIFGITGFIQWLYTVLFHEKLVEDKLRNYVDLCSVANVSVFILAHRQFGYYIHGRSVHGSADVSLAEMYAALQKENSGSCAKRGLEPDSMQQTYIMALPGSFRDSLDLVYRPGTVRSMEQNSTNQYLEVNKFLDRFLNRTNVPRITFRYQDRKFFEDVFDGEFEDNSIEGRFYRDNGVSFGNILFYGQELALITFDILLFCVVDLILQNTVLDAFITWGFVAILRVIRDACGAHNLAEKTLVDRRFLI